MIPSLLRIRRSSGSPAVVSRQIPVVAGLRKFRARVQVTDKTPPMFLTHSVRDTCVSVENSRMMVQALKAKNVPVEFMELTTGEHTLNALWGALWDSIRAKMLVWLEDQKMIPHADAAIPVRPSK